MAIRNDGSEDSEDDDDIVIGVGENFRKHIDALKRACVLEVGNGGYMSTPASILSGENPPGFEENDEEEEEDDEEDDEQLFMSIKSKYGSFGIGDSSPWSGKRAGAARGENKSDNNALDRAGEDVDDDDDEEEDDEEILRSVEKLYKTGVVGGSGGGEQVQSGLPRLPRAPEVVSPQQLKEIRDTNDGLRAEKESSPSPAPYPSPGCEAGGSVGGEDGGFSPQTRSETGIEQGEEAGRSISSFLPGNWNETDGDVEHYDAGPARTLEITSAAHWGDKLSPTPEETTIYSCPESAQVLTDALKKNKQCQRTLRNVLSQIEAKQKENAELQRRVRSLVDFEKYCNRRFAGFFTDQANPSVKLIAAKAPATQNKSSDSSSKTVSDLQTCGPPENTDVEIYKKLQKKVSFTFPCRRWSNDERIELAKGVKQQVYEVLVRQAMDTLSNADALDEDFNSLDDYVSKIGGKEFSPQQIRDAVPGIDWAEVARVYVVGRTPEECRTRWINHEDSLINKGPWKKLEDKKLLSIAQQHDFCAWEKIAEQLGTKRTPAECLTRYQRSLNASIMRSNWTPEEDDRLRAAVEEWGENDWSAVAACLEGRNNSQCLMRWYKVLHPTKKKRGRWSVEEDKRLKWAVSVYGRKKWKQIAEHVPGRTDLQCRERWCNVLDPSIKLGEWTEDEDGILEESVVRHGPHKWAAVANDLKIRTDNQCCRRWKFLHPEDQPEFQRTVHIRRTALVGNFQGRKKERSRLGPQDFISKGTDFGAIVKKPAVKRTVKDSQRSEPIGNGGDAVVDAAREHRAARILKRRLARAKNGTQKIASVPGAQTNNEFMDVIDPQNTTSERRPGSVNTDLGNIHESTGGTKRKGLPSDHSDKPGKRRKRMPSQVADTNNPSGKSARGRKRKAVHIADPVDPPRPSKLKVSRLNQGARVSSSQDTSRQVQSVGPEIASSVDLVQSRESYCSLLAEENNGLDILSDPTKILDPAETMAGVVHESLPVMSEANESSFEEAVSRKCSNGESNTSRRSMDVRDGDSRQNGHFSQEDEEVPFATRAVLSWPCSRAVQEFSSQDTSYMGSLGGADLGSQGRTDSGSPGKTDARSQGRPSLGSPRTTDFGSEGPTNVGSQGLAESIGLRSQVTTNLSMPQRTYFVSQGPLSMTSQGRAELACEGRTQFGSQGVSNAGSQVTTSLFPPGTTYIGYNGSSQNADNVGTNGGDQGYVSSTAVKKSKRISLRAQARAAFGSHGVTDAGPQAVAQVLSQEVTYLDAEASGRNSVQNGMNIGDNGSVAAVAMKKPRTKRAVRMRGALSRKTSKEMAMVSRLFQK
ncbi:unnamed protein product [Calypogeia fissa]